MIRWIENVCMRRPRERHLVHGAVNSRRIVNIEPKTFQALNAALHHAGGWALVEACRLTSQKRGTLIYWGGEIILSRRDNNG
jgi:hypothetical protein